MNFSRVGDNVNTPKEALSLIHLLLYVNTCYGACIVTALSLSRCRDLKLYVQTMTTRERERERGRSLNCHLHAHCTNWFPRQPEEEEMEWRIDCWTHFKLNHRRLIDSISETPRRSIKYLQTLLCTQSFFARVPNYDRLRICGNRCIIKTDFSCHHVGRVTGCGFPGRRRPMLLKSCSIIKEWLGLE